MPLITGNKTANESLKQLIYKDDVDLGKLRERCEVSAIKSWAEKQPHLPRLTEDQLLLFLHCNYFSIERTKETIDNYFTFRTHAPELYANRDCKTDLFEILKAIHIAPIPHKYKTSEGYYMLYLRLREFESSKFDFPRAVKAVIAALDVLIATNPMSEGLRIIFDMSHITLGHIYRITLGVLKKLMMYIQEAVPLRLKGIHVLNTFPLINQILALVKPLMKPELLAILYLHTPAELEDFNKKFVPLNLMPSDYGGELESVEQYHSDFNKRLETSRHWLADIENLKVDESKRIGQAKRSSDVYGMEGSFKKLDLD